MEKIKQALEASSGTLKIVIADEGASGLAKTWATDALSRCSAALSELEGSKPKELTDNEIERIVRMPVNMISDHGEAWSGMSERQMDCVRLFLMYVRDHGYLSPQPKEPPRYVMSRDYEALYELLCKGGEALGIKRVSAIGLPCYDPVLLQAPERRQRIADQEPFAMFHGIVAFGDDERTAFRAECTRLNLEWIAIEQPKEQGAEPVDPASPYDDQRLVQHLLNSLDWMYRSLSWSVARDRGFDGAFVNAGQMIYEAKRSGYFPKHQYGVALNPPTPTAREKALEEAGDAMHHYIEDIGTDMPKRLWIREEGGLVRSLTGSWTAAKSTK